MNKLFVGLTFLLLFHLHAGFWFIIAYLRIQSISGLALFLHLNLFFFLLHDIILSQTLGHPVFAIVFFYQFIKKHIRHIPSHFSLWNFLCVCIRDQKPVIRVFGQSSERKVMAHVLVSYMRKQWGKFVYLCMSFLLYLQSCVKIYWFFHISGFACVRINDKLLEMDD